MYGILILSSMDCDHYIFLRYINSYYEQSFLSSVSFSGPLTHYEHKFVHQTILFTISKQGHVMISVSDESPFILLLFCANIF